MCALTGVDVPNILYRQMGGYFGSNAGDCGVIIIGDLRILIDLGGRLKIHNETNQPAKYFFSRLLGIEEFTDRSAKIAAKKFREKTPASEMIVLISHFHEDHVAKGDLWSLLEYLGANSLSWRCHSCRGAGPQSDLIF